MLPREAASRALRQGLADWSRRLVQEGFGPLRARWEALAHGLGGPVRAEIGHERVEGLALGLTDDGALRVGLADGSERLISAGEVFFAVDAPA
jgi:BirA family biotin operon repressor/biotin-[acetyl-CoA-carboxylase] ligase